MKRKLSIILLIIITMTSTFSYGEIGIENELRSYILADAKTGQVLEEYNINEVVEIASISKLMTYLVVMDEVSDGKISLKDKIFIDQDIARIKGSTFDLKVGEVFTVEELLEASMVVSANDATYALSKHIAGTEENFAILMNEKAIQLGLKNAKFYNSTGLPQNRVQNMMTTKEIFELSKYIIEKYPEVLETSRKRAIEVISRDYYQKSTNPLLLKVKEVDGLKTGFTNKAGYCYVSTFNMEGKKDTTKDLRLISIVMGTKGLKERDELGRILVEYGLDNYSNKIFFDEEIDLGTIELPKGDLAEVKTYPENGLSKVVKHDEDIKTTISIDEEIKLPITKGHKVGKATVEKEGNIIFETDIIVKEDVKIAKWYVLFARYLGELYGKLFG